MTMGVRALWKGVIHLGDNEIPVKLYSSVQDKDVHFRLLHENDRVPVQQVMLDPETGTAVSKEEILRGYMTERGDIVILNEDELDQVKPDASRDIEIRYFLPRASIEHKWYRRPYYIGPDGDDESYLAFMTALKNTDTEVLVRWVMRNIEYFGSLRIHQNYPVLMALRYAEEVISISGLKRSDTRDIDENEQRMAEQLISAMEGEFDPLHYRDEYREKILQLIETKARGGTISLRKFKPKKREVDVKTALEKSLKAMERKSA
jgi:DNA end-binding protein Ku